MNGEISVNHHHRHEMIHRYLVFSIGLFIMSAGVSLITRSLTGTSPISSVPYVLSRNTPLSMGTYILFINLAMIAGQMLILGREGVKRCKWELIAQLPVSVGFGLFVDLTMYLFGIFAVESYWERMVLVVVGCVAMGVGISLEVIADVAMNSGEYLIHVASQRWHKHFGTLKICFDVSLVMIACGISLAFTGRIEGIREGTLIVALLTGPIVRLFMPRLSFLKNKF